jgi:hypothetical protein
MVVAALSSIGAIFRMISSNSALRLRNLWASPSRQNENSRNSHGGYLSAETLAKL